jgi:hypothetical protein
MSSAVSKPIVLDMKELKPTQSICTLDISLCCLISRLQVGEMPWRLM